MSFVMRPFLWPLAITSPDQMKNEFGKQAGMLRKGKGTRPIFSADERERIRSYYEGLCVICGRTILPGEPFEVDHIVLHTVGKVPKRTARDAYLNYRPTHSSCNRRRGAADFTDYAESFCNNPTVWVEPAWHRVP